MTLTEADIAELTPIIEQEADFLRQHFPAHRMNRRDFIQQGFLGVLTMRAYQFDSPEGRLKCQRRAARYEMIDAMRTYANFRPRHMRRAESLVLDFQFLTLLTLVDRKFEDRTIETYDARRRLALLSPREQLVVRERMEGKTLAEIGHRLQLTEGRMCQIEKSIIATLREAA